MKYVAVSLVLAILLGINAFFITAIIRREHELSAYKASMTPTPTPYLQAARLGELLSSPTIPPTAAPTAEPTPLPLPDKKLLTVPFIVQAPFGQWSRSVFQDGCEEAALLTAWHWTQGTELPENEIGDAIIAMTNFEDTTYGQAVDRSAEDTAQLFKDYFNYTNIEVHHEVTMQTIKRALFENELVIVPLNGRALAGSRYTPPGPPQHMLVITGYDDTTGEFITNDPGTKFGAGIRYRQEALLSAIRDYPTGNHLHIAENKKAMIIVNK